MLAEAAVLLSSFLALFTSFMGGVHFMSTWDERKAVYMNTSVLLFFAFFVFWQGRRPVLRYPNTYQQSQNEPFSINKYRYHLHLPVLHTTQTNNTINMPFTGSDICKIIFAVLLPPLGVFLERGCGADLLINLLLTILGYIPGIVHALYIICKY